MPTRDQYTSALKRLAEDYSSHVTSADCLIAQIPGESGPTRLQINVNVEFNDGCLLVIDEQPDLKTDMWGGPDELLFRENETDHSRSAVFRGPGHTYHDHYIMLQDNWHPVHFHNKQVSNGERVPCCSFKTKRVDFIGGMISKNEVNGLAVTRALIESAYEGSCGFCDYFRNLGFTLNPVPLGGGSE